MTDSGRRFGDAEERRELMERIARSADRTRELAERYLAILHVSERTSLDAQRLTTASRAVREQLHSETTHYVLLLRNEGAPRDLAVWLVKDLVQTTSAAVESAEVDLVHDLEVWAANVYSAA